MVVGTLTLGWIVLYFDRSLLFPLLPVMADEFDLNATQQGAITSIFFLLYVAVQVPSGILGDRLGLRRILTFMYFMAGLALVGIGVFSISYFMLLFFVAMEGFGSGAYYSGSYGITLSSVPQHHRGVSSAIVTSGMAIGFALGLSLSGVLYTLMGSWRPPFLIMAIPTFLMVLVFSVTLRRVPTPPVTKGGLSFIFSNKNTVSLLAVNFCALYAYWVMVSWGPSYLFEERGLSLSRSGAYTSIVAIFSLGGALLWGRLSDRVGRKKLSLLLLVMAATTLILFVQVTSTFMLILILAVYGLFGGLAWNPIFVSWVSDHTSASGRIGMGTAMGVVNTAGMSSSFVAPVVSGWLTDLSGSLDWAFYVGGGVCLLGIVFALITEETVTSSSARKNPGEQDAKT